jgi:3-oxoacyl-[acyl-carrier-protein] synthase II
MTRVVVTGFGVVSPLGLGFEKTWNNIIASKSGISKIPSDLFDSSDLKCKIAALVGQEQAESDYLNNFLTPNEQRRVGKFILYAQVAAAEAVANAGIKDMSAAQKDRTGVLIGSGIGGIDFIEENACTLFEKGPKKISPFFIPGSIINLASGQVSIKYAFTGPNHSVVSACSTGNHAIGDAARIIQQGDADIMVCGGTEGAVCKLSIAGFAAARALSTKYNDNPQAASRPWDKDRDGFVMGEGAGILILENYETAKKRGANILAELVGYGLSGDAFHITSPDQSGKGAKKSMQMAIEKANISPDKIGYINAHGTSTPAGDVIEINALKEVLQQHANITTISSTKSSIGHLLGAAGSLEAILTILAINNGIAPPTLNLDNPEESCQGLNLTPKTAQEINTLYGMSNSFGFGGTNSTLIFRKI